MKIYLIRHSLTEGNLKKRYVGITDEDLSQEGVKLLERCFEKGGFPQAERIYTSPMKMYSDSKALLSGAADICNRGVVRV